MLSRREERDFQEWQEKIMGSSGQGAPISLKVRGMGRTYDYAVDTLFRTIHAPDSERRPGPEPDPFVGLVESSFRADPLA